MIPLRDSVRTRRFPLVVLLIVLANAAAFAWEVRQGAQLDAVVTAWGVVPAEWIAATRAPAREWRELLTVASSMFLHGGIAHLLGNMWFLWVFGDNVEDRLGRAGFAGFYAVCGAAAAASQVALEPASTVPMIGASGAVAGVLGAYVRLYPRARVSALFPLVFVWFFREVSALAFLGVWFLVQVGSSLLGLSGVAWWAHIAGFLVGVVLSLFAPGTGGDGPPRARGGKRRPRRAAR